MKSLVVFYSRTGATKQVAEELAKLLGADVEEIFSVKDRSGALGYVMSGKEALLKELAEIKPVHDTLEKYDLVVVGTPVWSFTLSSPVRSYLYKKHGYLKRVAFFCTQGRSGAETAFKEMQDICGKKPVATLVLSTKEVKTDEYHVKLEGFAGILK